MAKKIWLMLFTSLLLIVVMIFTSYTSIKSLIKQRKISELKNDFISNMTHELKTPISSIQLACETLSDPNFQLPENMRSNYVKIISDENKRLKTLVNNVLDSTLLDRDNLELNITSFDLSDLLKETIQRFHIILENNQGSIEFSGLESVLIMGDKFHLANVFFNLIDNAIKYSESAPNIRIEVQKSELNKIQIRITDQGMGIPKTDLNKIFDKFHRVSQGNLHNVKGFGLGLSYVKRIIDLHQGQINVTSEIKKGSTFCITLPYNHEA